MPGLDAGGAGPALSWLHRRRPRRPLPPSAPAAAGAANSGKARYTKQETRGQGDPQTELTKPQAPPRMSEEGDRADPDRRGVHRVRSRRRSRRWSTQIASRCASACIAGDRRRRSPEAGLPLPHRRALRREAALLQLPGARLDREDLRGAAGGEAPPAAASRRLRAGRAAKWLLEAVKALRRCVQVPQVREDGRGPLQASPTCSRPSRRRTRRASSSSA